MIALRDVSAALGDTRALEGVDLDVARGAFVGLVGPNGAGKTTLLRTINGLVRPAAGTVTVDGEDVAALSARAVSRRVATLPQSTSLSFAFDVRDVVAMGRTPHRSRFERASEADREHVRHALERTRTAHLAERSIEAVSGGERQRVLLARALCQDASVLLLDEPTASLDIGHAVRTLELVRELVGEGKTALAAIHDLDLAARFCDELALLADGRVIAAGPPAAVLTEAALEAAFEVPAAVASHPVTGARSVVALTDRPERDARVHVLGGGRAGAAIVGRCWRAGFELSVGPLPEGDVAAERARTLGVEPLTVSPFDAPSGTARRAAAALVREADLTVLLDAASSSHLRDLAAGSDAVIVVESTVAGERPSGGLAERPRTQNGLGTQNGSDGRRPTDDPDSTDRSVEHEGRGTDTGRSPTGSRRFEAALELVDRERGDRRRVRTTEADVVTAIEAVLAERSDE